MNIDISKVANSKIYDNPRWELKIPTIRYDLCKFKKDDTQPIVFIGEFHQIQEEYTQHQFIYTDGSKINEQVGSAAVLGNRTIRERLPDHASIFFCGT